MLKDPFLNKRFEPGLVWFVGVFDVYDREETKGAELGVYNPDDSDDREFLIRNYCLTLPCLSYRHKFVLFEYLENVLKDSDFNFQSIFDIDECDTNSWPRGEWYSLSDPQSFFQAVHKLAKEVWREELIKAAVEDKSTW